MKLMLLELPSLATIKSHVRDRNSLMEIRKAITLYQERLQLCGGGITAGGPSSNNAPPSNYVPDLVLEQCVAKFASMANDK